MIAEIDRGLALIDQRFTELAANGDERANRFLESLTRARTELDTLAAQASTQDDAIGSLAERTTALRESIDRLAAEIRDGVGTAIGEAQGGADRLVEAAAAVRPEIGWMRDAAVEASERLAATGAEIAEQQDRFAALLASVDDGVERRAVEARRARLDARPGRARGGEPQRRDRPGAGRVAGPGQGSRGACRRARPRSDRGGHPGKRRQAVGRDPRRRSSGSIRESVEERLREVESVAARAVESARAASDRLTQQMLTLGQSAAALERISSRPARTSARRTARPSPARRRC